MRMRSVALATLLSVLAVLTVLQAFPAAALTGDESCFYNAINRERAKVGHPALVLADDMTGIARRHSQLMAADGTIYHNNNLGNEIPGKWSAAGENVGMGPDCPSIHDAFMSSPGHRANILDTDYNHVGVGVSYDKDGTVYITEDFVGRASAPPRPRAVVQRPRPKSPATQPRPPSKPKQTIAPAEPRTVEVLLMLLGLDAKRVNAATGEALGV